MFNITPLVRTLLIINVVVFVGQNLSPYVTAYFSLSPIGSPYFEPYQFLTYMFAHGGIGHIFFNMFALASFAPILETYWGEKKFLFFYLACGIGAGMIYGGVNYFLAPYLCQLSPMFSAFCHGGGPMLGASGAIYGVLMAFALVFPNMELMLLFVPIPIKAKYFVFLIGGVTYLMDHTGTVAHLAHFGGAFVAFIIINYWRSQGGR